MICRAKIGSGFEPPQCVKFSDTLLKFNELSKNNVSPDFLA